MLRHTLGPVQIVAHRGLHKSLPENSLAALEAAIGAGADAVEFDVRVTRDGVAVVTHWLECELSLEGVDGYLFEHDRAELRAARLKGSPPDAPLHMPTLVEVLDALAGRVGLEIEIKGPGAEVAQQIARSLLPHRRHWGSIEVTSFEPALLHAFSREIEGRVALDLLFPRPEPWMTKPIGAYLARAKAGLAHARAVHLHPSQLDTEVVGALRDDGFLVHSYEVNDDASFAHIAQLGIERFDTDELERALALRRGRARADGDDPVARADASAERRPIRRATTEDAPVLRALLNSAYRSLAASGLNFTAASQDEELTRHQIRTREVYLMERAREIVGTVRLRDRVDEAGVRHLYVSGLAVRPDLQGLGLGGELLRFAEAVAGDRGIRVLRLDTAKPATHLIELYTHAGYRACGERHWEGKMYDSVIMEKVLSRDRIGPA